MNGGEPIFINKNSKTGILMLHGFTSTPHQFKELAAFFAEKGFNVSSPLIAGHGSSPDELIKTSAEDWKKSVKEAYLKLKENSSKIFIIGNSFGANLGFWLVKEFNNEQAGIVSLGAPIFLRFHLYIEFRYWFYGRFKKFYKKPMRVYKTDYIDFTDEITYPVIPIKSLREFLDFIENETKPNLKKIKIPILVAHSNIDLVVKPKSAAYIYGKVSSSKKQIFWFPSSHHTMTYGNASPKLFDKIFEFVKNA